MHGTGGPLGRYSREVPADAKAGAARTAEVLRAARRVLVCGHTGADGDVVGSSLALAWALKELGKVVVVYNEKPYPASFAWLPGGDQVVNILADDATFDATVVVDAADPTRLGRSFPPPARRGTFVWMDHHKIDALPGDVNYVDLTAAAVGEQVVEVIDAMGHPLGPDVARCVYASLLSDTGGFRYGNTSSRAFSLAARLVDAGVDPWEMTQRIYESQAAERVRLLGRALSRLWISPCGRLGVVDITAEDMHESGATDEHVQGIVNHVRGIQGVEVAVLVRPMDRGAEVVLRSRGNIDVSPIAQRLGAQGHKNAARVILAEDVIAARARVLEAALAVIDPEGTSHKATIAAAHAQSAEHSGTSSSSSSKAGPRLHDVNAPARKRPRRAADRGR